MDSKVVAVVGAGPVGGILAARLCLAGHTVLLVDVWREHIERIRNDGLRIHGEEELLARPEHLFISPSELGDILPEFVFICTKATGLDAVLSDLSDRVKQSKAVFVSAQNGIDTEEIIARQIERRRVVRGVISYAGILTGPGEIRETFFDPPNYFGWLEESGRDSCEEAARLLTHCGLATEATGEVKKAVWRKAILNCGTMPIAALTGMTIKQLMAFPPTRRIVGHLLKESIAVAASLGFDYGPDFFDFAIDLFERAGAHKPSMLVDIEQGRVTENAFLMRRIAEYAEENGVPAHTQRTMANLVDAIDNRNRSRYTAS